MCRQQDVVGTLIKYNPGMRPALDEAQRDAVEAVDRAVMVATG